MRPRLSVPLTAMVLLALLEAHRRLLGSVILDSAAALQPPARPLALLMAVLPVLLLCIPALPLPAGHDRRAVVAAAAAIAALGRLGAATPQSQGAGLAAGLAMAAAAVYLGAGVGLLARRTVAGGAALAFALDITIQWLGGPAAEPSRPVRIGIPIAEAVVLLVLAGLALRTTLETTEGPERRAGGLRLRGALALGAILFLESSVLAAPAVAARRGLLDRGLLQPALAAVAVGSAIWLMAGGGPARLYRPRLVLMGALAGAAAVLVGPVRGSAAAVLVVAGHVCALLLLGRALAPAGGRRGHRTATGVVGMLIALDGCLALAAAAPPELAPTAVPWVYVIAALVLVGALVLIPRPGAAPPLLPRAVARAALALGVVAGLALGLAAARRGAHTSASAVPSGPGRPESESGGPGGSPGAPAADSLR